MVMSNEIAITVNVDLVSFRVASIALHEVLKHIQSLKANSEDLKQWRERERLLDLVQAHYGLNNDAALWEWLGDRDWAIEQAIEFGHAIDANQKKVRGEDD